jgi:hypothetical protein
LHFSIAVFAKGPEAVGSGKGNGRTETPSTTERDAVVAPMPSASINTALMENPSDLPQWRDAFTALG